MHCGVRPHVNLTAASLDIGKCRALMPSHSWKICVRGCPPGPESTDKRCSSSTVNLAWMALRRVADRPPKTLAARLVAVACTMHRAGPRTEACLAAAMLHCGFAQSWCCLKSRQVHRIATLLWSC